MYGLITTTKVTSASLIGQKYMFWCVWSGILAHSNVD